MADKELQLKISKRVYETKISVLKQKLEDLENTVTAYERKKTELPSFMESTDDNYENTLQMIDDNIKRVRRAYNSCKAGIEILQKNMEAMEEFGENIERDITEATTTARKADEAFDLLK